MSVDDERVDQLVWRLTGSGDEALAALREICEERADDLLANGREQLHAVRLQEFFSLMDRAIRRGDGVDAGQPDPDTATAAELEAYFDAKTEDLHKRVEELLTFILKHSFSQ